MKNKRLPVIFSPEAFFFDVSISPFPVHRPIHSIRREAHMEKKKIRRGWMRSFAAAVLVLMQIVCQAQAQTRKPNILVIFGDDIGLANISAYSMGIMGYRTPNIDRIAREGMIFTDYYAEQSCTAGRSAFITGQCTFRTG